MCKMDGIENTSLDNDTSNRDSLEKDNCTICHGERGGVLGNENVIAGVVMCDYCSADRMRSLR